MENELILKGNIIAILPTVVTEKSGKTYHNRTFVIESKSEKSDYVNQYAFELFGEEKTVLINKFAEGQYVSVWYNVPTSRLYNGKWYTNNPRAWKIKAESEAPADFSQPAPQLTAPTPQATAQTDAATDEFINTVVLPHFDKPVHDKLIAALKQPTYAMQVNELQVFFNKAKSEKVKSELQKLIDYLTPNIPKAPEAPEESNDLPF